MYKTESSHLDFIEYNILELKQTLCIGKISFLTVNNENFSPKD